MKPLQRLRDGQQPDSLRGGWAVKGLMVTARLLGSEAALEAARSIKERKLPLRHPFEAVGFTAEEGGEMGGTFGSRAIAGMLDEPLPEGSAPGALAERLRRLALSPGDYRLRRDG